MIDHLYAIIDYISDPEQMLYVLRGLDSNFSPLVTNIIGKKRILSLDELFTCIRTHDQQQARMNSTDTQLV